MQVKRIEFFHVVGYNEGGNCEGGGSLRLERGLSQEGLKIIACVTMLIDHIGAALVPVPGLRIVGRVAFPIYCFLMAEGMARTRNTKKYGLRLAIGALLAELPFDLLLYGGFTWMHQSVMVTLLLGWGMTLWINRSERGKLVPVIVCALAAELLGADYGAAGIAMIALFVLTQEQEDRLMLQVLGLVILCWMMGGAGWQVFGVHIPAQIFGAAAMVPICLYRGRKITASRVVQWGFYLFYPVHLVVLWVIGTLM